MVHLSYWFRCLLLLGLFFVVHSSAYANYGGNGIKEEEHGEIVSDQKELGFTWKTRVGGRKLVIDRALDHKREVKEEGASPSPSTISTEEKTLGKDQHQDQSNHQKKSTLSSGRSEQNDEERELVSLMHKDYSRFGRRKPPINNHEPRH